MAELKDLFLSYTQLDEPNFFNVETSIQPEKPNLLDLVKSIPLYNIRKESSVEQELPTVEDLPIWKGWNIQNSSLNKSSDNKFQNYNGKSSNQEYSPQKTYKGLSKFNEAYDNVEREMPEARKYRKFLTQIAEAESNFNSSIKNRAGAPAYGYFQFMQDGKKYNNITRHAKTDINTFRNSPELQIKAAISLAKEFESQFSQQDILRARSKGFSIWGMLGGAWLGGAEGVKKFLRGAGDSSDKHWSSSGKGSTVGTYMRKFN